MESWQIAFGVLQIVFVIAMGWAVRVVMGVKHDYIELEKRVVELEKTDAVKDEKINNIQSTLCRIEKTLIDFIEKVNDKIGMICL